MVREFRAESFSMRFFRKIGMKRISWSFRRLHCPVDKNAIVLEIGSGGNPYPRSNVLLDKYEDTIERFHVPLVKDRPTVLGLAERLPFKDESFDFIIASHVLEHTVDPVSFLKEMMRVGKAGYIETPDAFFERINPYRFHRLEITELNGKLMIFKKPSWRHDTQVVDMYENKAKNEFIKLISKHPEPFFVRFYWKDKIDYEIVNPEVDANWAYPDQCNDENYSHKTLKIVFRELMRKTCRYLMSQRDRNKQIDMIKIICCPTCSSDNLSKRESNIFCKGCSTSYPIRDGVPIMYPVSSKI